MDRDDRSRLPDGLLADLQEAADQVLETADGVLATGGRADRRLLAATLVHGALVDLQLLAAAEPSWDRRVALLAMALELERVAELLERRLGPKPRRRVHH